MTKENISTIFLLPAVEIPETVKDKFYEQGFISTYLTCNKLSYPFEVIYILFNPGEFSIDYNYFERMLINNPNYIEVFDLGNNLVLYVYKIPDKFKEDYNLFLQGKYSKFSKEYKKLFPERSYIIGTDKKPIRDHNGKYKTEMSPFHHVFNRSDYIKSKWADKIGYEIDDPIFDNLELYDVQYPERELVEVNIEI